MGKLCVISEKVDSWSPYRDVKTVVVSVHKRVVWRKFDGRLETINGEKFVVF